MNVKEYSNLQLHRCNLMVGVSFSFEYSFNSLFISIFPQCTEGNLQLDPSCLAMDELSSPLPCLIPNSSEGETITHEQNNCF